MTVGEFLSIPCEENVEFIMINYCNNHDNISFTKNKLTHEKYLKKDMRALKIKEIYVDNNNLIVELKFDKSFFKFYKEYLNYYKERN